MFKLIALLFLVTNGVTAEKPSAAIGSNALFDSEKDCKGYLDTEAGKVAKKTLNGFIAAQKQKIKVKIACVKIEDNTI